MANILRLRRLSERIARAYLMQRIDMGFPLLPQAEREEAVRTYREKYGPVEA
jgi:hypothetical protein